MSPLLEDLLGDPSLARDGLPSFRIDHIYSQRRSAGQPGTHQTRPCCYSALSHGLSSILEVSSICCPVTSDVMIARLSSRLKPARWQDRAWLASEKDAKLAQKLGQLQPFIAVFPQRYRTAWTNLHILGQPNTFLAAVL
jgi:hypothetical protein